MPNNHIEDDRTTRVKALAKEILSGMKPIKPTPLMSAAMSGSLDSYLARETVRALEGKETFTVADIRNAQNKIYGIE